MHTVCCAIFKAWVSKVSKTNKVPDLMQLTLSWKRHKIKQYKQTKEIPEIVDAIKEFEENVATESDRIDSFDRVGLSEEGIIWLRSDELEGDSHTK